MPDIFKWHHNQCYKFYSYKLSNSLRVLVVFLEKDVISSCPLLNTFNSSCDLNFQISSYISPIQFSSVAQSCLTLCNPMNRSMPGLPVITNSQSLLKVTPIESVMPSSHLILCRPFLLLSPIPPSIRVFSNESILHMRWPKYWSFSFSIIIYSTFTIQILRSELIVLIFRSLY